MIDSSLLVFFTSCFVTLFVVLDPVGTAPIFAGLTEGTSPSHRRRMAYRSVGIAAIILLVFTFGGEWLMGALGISLGAFRAAGGVLLFIIALDMIFEKRTEQREGQAGKVGHQQGVEEDISVFPMAIPLLAGPGAIATVMLFMAQADGNLAMQGVVLLSMFITLLLCLVLFLAVGFVMRILGQTLAAMLTRILGVILAALAAQFIFDGIRSAMAA